MTKSRTLTLSLAAALGVTAVAPATLSTAAPAARWDSTSFVMNAKVLDGGQQVVSLTLDTAGRTVDPRSLTASTFRVRAKGVNPYAGLAPSEVAGTFDVQRTVTGAHLDRSGDIVVELAHGEGVPGASTLAYATKPGRNVVRDLTYSLTQTAPVRLKSGAAVQLTSFHQGGVVDPEVDAFGAGASRNGLEYRYYAPKKSLRPARSKAPLILFLHGGGEGGWSKASNNDLPLLANRGALAFATTRWLDDGEYSYTRRLKSLVDEFAKGHDVDTSRIYVVGPSNGGYMAMRLASAYPRYFAANVPVCAAYVLKDQATGTTQRMLTDAQILRLRSTPTWFVHATNDPVVDYQATTGRAVRLLGNARLTAYPNVVWNGHEFPGHWPWIYVARNDPQTASGVTIWEWMAKQRRR